MQPLRSKHCKLCDKCCTKFDHHCIYVNKCIGLKNQKYFFFFILTTLLNTTVFVANICLHLNNFKLKLEQKHLEQPIEDRISFLYYLAASPYHIWLVILAVMNGLPMIMVVVLLVLQLRVISLGFTSQYPPPFDFTEVSKNTKTYSAAIRHRLNNLSIFFFKSYEDNAELFHRQQQDYLDAKFVKPTIPTDYYPKNGPENDLLFNSPDFFNLNGSMKALGEKNPYLIDDSVINMASAKSTNSVAAIKDKQFEIELD